MMKMIVGEKLFEQKEDLALPNYLELIQKIRII